MRIALALKGLHAEQVPVHLVADGGQQHRASYRNINPQALVPSFKASPDDAALHQSLAIIEYLDERWPNPRLLPEEPLLRARVRAFAMTVASEVQPLQNLRVLQYLEQELQLSKEQRNAFARHWMALGFVSLEESLESGNAFCFGNSPGLGDIVLVPQMYNARRFGLDLKAFPKLVAIDARCRALAAFAQAAPEQQPDAA